MMERDILMTIKIELEETCERCGKQNIPMKRIENCWPRYQDEMYYLCKECEPFDRMNSPSQDGWDMW